MAQSQSTPKLAPAKRRRIRRTTLVRIAALTIGVGAIALIIYARSGMARHSVLPRIAKMINAEVDAERVVIAADGSVILRRAQFRVPGQTGVASTFFRVEQARIWVDWLGAIGGGGRINRVELDGPHMRVSQSVETGRLNIADISLLGLGGDTSDASFSLPTLVARGGTVEVGEHDARGYTTLTAVPFAGQLEPRLKNKRPGYSFQIRQLSPGGADVRRPIALSGRIDEFGIELQLDGVDLEDWTADVIPTRYREIYRRSNLEGRVRPTTFSMSSDGSLRVMLSLEGVGLNLPFDKDGNFTPDGPLVRMTNTSGWVRFENDQIESELRGVLDTLEYTVRLNYNGTDLDSGFMCSLETEFRLEEDMDVLILAPDEVIEKLDMFSRPSADVAATLNVIRDSPVDGQPMPLKIWGDVEINNGVAAFTGFPYRFENLSGHLTFDRQTLTLASIRGLSPSGAQLRAEGVIPLGDDGQLVEIDLSAEGVPVDAALREALNEERLVLLETLFSEQRYAELLASGLLSPPGTVALSDDPPEFTFGGACDVTVALRRPTGPGGEWTKRIIVDLPQAGMIPEQFPLPLRAQDVRLEITDDRAMLTGGRYQPLRGGWATIEGVILFDDDGNSQPTVVIESEDVPIDDLLLNAIPGYRSSGGELGAIAGGDAGSLRELLDRLRLEGRVDCRVDLEMREDGRLGYDVETSVYNVRARPQLFDESIPELTLEELVGTIYVREDIIVVGIEAEAAPASASPGDRPSIPVELFTQIDAPEGARWGEANGSGRGAPIYADAKLTRLDPGVPLEHFVAVFSPDAAGALARLNATHAPTGQVDVRARVVGELGQRIRPELSLENLSELTLTVMDRPVHLSESSGRVRIDAGEEPELLADAFRARLELDGHEGGTLSIDGRLPLLSPDDAPDRPIEGELALRMDTRIESTLTRSLLGDAMGDGLASLYDEHEPRGAYAAIIEVRPDPDPEAPASAGSMRLPPLHVQGAVEPESISFLTDQGRVVLEIESGRIGIDGANGRLENLRLRGSRWKALVRGHWQRPGDDAFALQADASLDSDGLPDDLLALLPETARNVLTDLEVEVTGSVRGRGLRLNLERAPGDDRLAADFSGTVYSSLTNANVGVPLTEIDGRLDLEVQTLTGRAPEFIIDLSADRLRAAGVRVSDAHARFRAGEDRGSVLVPTITGAIHGGRLAGSAQILSRSPDGDSGESVRSYWADAQLSRVRAAPLLSDLGIAEKEAEELWSESDDLSRGLLDASVSLSADVNDPASRVGRGSVIVSGGEVVELPLFLQLIEFSNLQAPVAQKLDLAQTDFFVEGDLITFENISVFSPSVEIFGYGRMRWPASDLDLVFRSQAVRPIPFLSDLIEGVRDELVTTRVTGSPPDIQYGASQFRGTRSVVRSLLGGKDTDQQRRLREIERRARTEHARARLEAQRVANTLDTPDAVGSVLPPNERGFANMEGGENAEPVPVASEPIEIPIGED